jgi:hypothetical protein
MIVGVVKDGDASERWHCRRWLLTLLETTKHDTEDGTTARVDNDKYVNTMNAYDDCIVFLLAGCR